MATWYPGSGITFQQYLQANSFVRDITGQIKCLDKSNNVNMYQMQTVINELQKPMGEIAASIESLQSSFDYSLGLILEEFQIRNQQISNIIEKLDLIHQTLKNPLLTQARELYQIGCQRMLRGLLGEALEAFHEAEKKNDVDFFIQFRIGKLYLYGINKEINVINLNKAREHLLAASRFGKAEVGIDPAFSKLAAEASLTASIASFALTGQSEKSFTQPQQKTIIEEARQLAFDAVHLNGALSEAYYHIGRYSALLSDPNTAINWLKAAVAIDRNYLRKIVKDKVFQTIKKDTIELLRLYKQID